MMRLLCVPASRAAHVKTMHEQARIECDVVYEGLNLELTHSVVEGSVHDN